MWPEVKVTKEENRHELLLCGSSVNDHLKESNGELDENVFTLHQLNFLKISSTSITEISSQIGKLVNLSNLVLQKNDLKSLPESIGELSKLKLLDISNNCLEMLPENICKLSSVMTLNASNNCLKTVPDLKDCCLLAHLDLRHNNLTEFPEICSENLNVLAEVLLASNDIKSIPEDISDLQSLKILDLIDNAVTDVPGEIIDCPKLKDLKLKSNPIKDRRLKKLIENDRTQPKQVMDYVKQHCAKSSASGKKKNKNEASEKKNEVNDLCEQIHVLKLTEDNCVINYAENVKEVRPYIVCCVFKSIDLSGIKFKQFLAAQTNLHEQICEKRLAATIATHDLKSVKFPLTYCAVPYEEIRIKPLGYAKEYAAVDFLSKLKKEADIQRKQNKRNKVSGISKYINLLDHEMSWPCLKDSENSTLSLHPITNSELTKLTSETTEILAEVTSSVSLSKAKDVMEALVLTLLQLGATSQTNENGKSILKVQQTKVISMDGSARVLYPSHIDLKLDNDNIQVLTLD